MPANSQRLFLLERNRIESQRNAKTNAMVIGIGKIGQFARRQLEQDTTLRVVCVVGGKADGYPQGATAGYASPAGYGIEGVGRDHQAGR